MDTYSLYDLNEYIKRVIALNFPEPIWISCEIAQCKQARGHYYLDLVEQNEQDEVIAQNSAVIWSRTLYFIKSKLGDLLPSLLQEGMKIKVRVNVEFNERYGFKLVIEDIDATFTLGQMELNRQKILERLNKSGVAQLNQGLVLPKIIQRLAVISSETAAGYIDFKTHLSQNNYGYNLSIDLYNAAMQGANTDNDVVTALTEIKKKKEKYDAIILIRGGGSRLDLAAFDSYNIGYGIATATLPVFTGIGHEIDQSIADLMAHTSLKTPTAVADFIIEHNANFESTINDFANVIASFSSMLLKSAHLNIETQSTFIQTSGIEKLKWHKMLVQRCLEDIYYMSGRHLKNNSLALQGLDTSIQLSSPDKIMRRGFAIVQSGGRIITKNSLLNKGDEATLHYFDGQRSIIIND